jgi:hypothetical protein
VPGSVLADHFEANKVLFDMGNFNSRGAMDHMFDSTGANGNRVTLWIIAHAVQRNILNFLLSAEIFSGHLYGDPLGTRWACDVIEKFLPVMPLEMEILHGEDLILNF